MPFTRFEYQSRAALPGGVVTEVRAGLDKDGGLPSAHALAFIADRLMEAGDNDLADAIDDALLKHGIAPQGDGQRPVMASDGAILEDLQAALNPDHRGLLRAVVGAEANKIDIFYHGPDDLWLA